MSYKKDCEFFISKKEAEKKFPNFRGRKICCHKDGKKDFIDNNNKCPPYCKFYMPKKADTK